MGGDLGMGMAFSGFSVFGLRFSVAGSFSQRRFAIYLRHNSRFSRVKTKGEQKRPIVFLGINLYKSPTELKCQSLCPLSFN
jgi:hypothetical protein